MSAKFAFNPKLGFPFAAMIAGVALFCAAGRAAACELTLDEAPDAVRIEYNPFAIGPSSGPLDLAFRNAGDASCQLRLVFIDDVGNPLPGLTLGGVGVEFRPREASGLFRRDVEPGVFTLQVAPDSVVRAELDAAVVRDAVVEAGEHAADLRLAVQDVGGQALLPLIPLRVLLLATPRAQLNIAGAAGAYGSGSSVEVIDFGVAETGAARRAFLQIRANAGSTLTIQSEHRGVMRHVELGETGSTVPYALELDGAPVDLAKVWTREVDPPRTLEGISLPLDFTLGAVEGRMSGNYEDLITINISPR